MKKILTIPLLLLAVAPLASAQNWSVGAGTGAFVFGDFVERRLRPVNADGPEDPITMTLSAATRPGLAVDVERSFSDRWAVRFEGTFTHSDLSIQQEGSSDGVELDAGELNVTTWMLPVVFRINPRGTFRFHILGGPALAIYDIKAPPSQADITVPGDTRDEWGAAFGGGVGWWLSDRFAVEGNITDIVTTSPFEELDDDNTPGIDAKRPHNVHTTIGVRYRF